jgi:hypothetical protein
MSYCIRWLLERGQFVTDEGMDYSWTPHAAGAIVDAESLRGGC